MCVISVSHLTKDYGSGKGVFDLSFEIKKGEVFGFLGPNGAGKTTTIRHLMGFLNADSGSCQIDGLDCRTEAQKIQEMLGYLPGEIAFFDEMTGHSYLNFISELRRTNNSTKRKELINFFELDDNIKIKKMSKGMKQKLGLVSALMHEPEVLILDEPTSGLDPLMQNRFVEWILREKAKGTTIFMSSHSFEEVERTCDRIGIIRSGRFAAVETVQRLKKAQRKIYLISFASSEEADRFCGDKFKILSQDRHHVQVAVQDDLNMLIGLLSQYDVVSMNIVSQSLEEVFMSYYGGKETC